MHLATALQVPVVAKFWADRARIWPSLSLPQHRMSAPTWHADLGVRKARFAVRVGIITMQHVTVSEVLAAAQHLWDSQEVWHDQAAFEVGHLYHRAVFDPLHQVLHQTRAVRLPLFVPLRLERFFGVFVRSRKRQD